MCKCGGLIHAKNKAYGYTGKVCFCEKPEPRENDLIGYEKTLTEKILDEQGHAHTKEDKENPEVSQGGSLRYNKGKPQFSNLSPHFILEMMKGMTAANDKYPYLNYTKKMDVRTASDSLMRHFLKFQQGHDIDEELGTHHMALVAINAMIIYQNLLDFGDKVDSRYQKEKERVQGEKGEE